MSESEIAARVDAALAAFAPRITVTSHPDAPDAPSARTSASARSTPATCATRTCTSWTSGWTTSYRLAEDVAYARTSPPVLPSDGFPAQGPSTPARTLDAECEREAVRISRERIRRARVRLAFLINRAAAGKLGFR